MLDRTVMRICEPGLSLPKPNDKKRVAIEGYLLKKKSTRLVRRVYVRRYFILSHDGPYLYICHSENSTTSYDIIDLADNMMEDEDDELDLTPPKDDEAVDDGEDGDGATASKRTGKSVSLKTGEVIEESDEESDDDGDPLFGNLGGVSVSHVDGGKTDGSRFIIRDNRYREYKLEADTPELAKVWVHRLKLILQDVRIAKNISEKRGTDFQTEYRKEVEYRLSKSMAIESMDQDVLRGDDKKVMGSFIEQHLDFKGKSAVSWPLWKPDATPEEDDNKDQGKDDMEDYVSIHGGAKPPSGLGKLLFQDGSYYLGPVVEGAREGKLGRMFYADGKVYVGEWKKDKPDGRGLLKEVRSGSHMPEKKLYCGLFKDTHQLSKHVEIW